MEGLQSVPVCNILIRAETRTLLDSDWEETLSTGGATAVGRRRVSERRVHERSQTAAVLARRDRRRGLCPAAHIQLSPLRSAGAGWGGVGKGGGLGSPSYGTSHETFQIFFF